MRSKPAGWAGVGAGSGADRGRGVGRRSYAEGAMAGQEGREDWSRWCQSLLAAA